jgi:hypothetical protein
VNPEYRQPVPQPLLAIPSVVTGRAQSRIFFGILLALVGIGIGAIGLVISYADSSWFGPTMNGLILRMGIEAAAFASAAALGGIGLFLVFFYIARIRPATRPWTSGAALVLLVTGIAAAILQIAFFLLWPSFFSGLPSENAIRLLFTIAAIRAAVGVAGSTATILGLFGLTKPSISL